VPAIGAAPQLTAKTTRQFSSDAWDKAMRRYAVIPALAAGLLVTGCGAGEWAHDVGGRINPDSLGFADRCANMMKAAMPFADIDITARTSQNTGISTMTAQAAGTRTDNEKDPSIARDVAVECKFDSNVLIDFHWTKGAPQH
jgi:hypothetical protein